MRVIRVTEDGGYRPRMMSDRANAFVDGDTVLVFCATDDGPRFFRVHLSNGQVERISQRVPFGGETEGWYFTLTGRIVLPHGPTLLSVDPENGDQHELLNISDMPGHDLWQPHSSDDGRTHSATVRRIVDSGRYPYVGTVIQGPHGRRFEAAIGQLDESQVTRAGTHAVIKENGEDNRIIDLASGDVWDLADAAGAFGHSDCGPDFIVGECNLPSPGRCVKMNLRTRERTDLFPTDNMGYVSVRGDRCLHSGETHLSLVDLQSGALTQLIEHGAPITNDYDLRVKASLSPCARVATYMVNGNVYLLLL